MFQFYINFNESAPNVAEWIQLIISLVSLVITIFMLCYARKALRTWKEDKFDTYILDAEIQINDYSFIYYKYLKSLQNVLEELSLNEFLNLGKQIKQVGEELKSKRFFEITTKLIKIKTAESVIKNYLVINDSFNKIQLNYFQQENFYEKHELDKEQAELLNTELLNIITDSITHMKEQFPTIKMVEENKRST